VHQYCRLVDSVQPRGRCPRTPCFTDWLHDTFDHATEVWTKPTSGSEGCMSRGATMWTSIPDQTAVHLLIIRAATSSCEARRAGILEQIQGVYAAMRIGLRVTFPVARRVETTSARAVGYRPGCQDRQYRQKSWWETRFKAYWGWPAEPQVIGSPPATGPCPTAFAGNPISDQRSLTATLAGRPLGQLALMLLHSVWSGCGRRWR